MLSVLVLAMSFSMIIAIMRSGRLAEEYRAKAGWYAIHEDGNLTSQAAIERDRAEALARGNVGEAGRLERFLSQSRDMTAWYARKRRLYQEAASRPWSSLPVELQATRFPHMEPRP